MKKIFLVFICLASFTQAATVLYSSERVEEWVDTAPSGTTKDELSLEFGSAATVITMPRVIRRGTELRLFLRSEEVQAEKIELVSILGDSRTVLISVGSNDGSFFMRDGKTFYDYSEGIFLGENDFEELRNVELEIVATPAQGSSFNVIPEPSSMFLGAISFAGFILRRIRG